MKSLPDMTSETLANFSKDSLTELEVNEINFTAFDVYNTDVCLKVQKCSFKVKAKNETPLTVLVVLALFCSNSV